MLLFSFETIYPLLRKFFFFGIIGGISFVLDFAFVYSLKEKIKVNKYVANSISFCIIGYVNFRLNRHFTFPDSTADYNMQLLRFFIVAGTGLLLNNAITYFFTEKREYNFYFSKLLATFIVIFWNFSMNKIFTFS